MRHPSFRQRLTLYSALGIAFALVAGSLATYAIERAQLRGQVDATLRNVSKGVVLSRARAGSEHRVGRPPISGGVLFEVKRASQPSFGTLPSYVTVIDRTGKRTLSLAPDVNLPVLARAVEIAKTGKGDLLTDVRVKGVHLRMRAAPFGRGHAILVAQSLSEVDRALGRLAWSLGITAAFGVALAALVGALVARRALAPVRRLTETAERVAATRDLGERIATDGDDELGRLGATFNSMLDSLESAMRSQRQLVSDASHELRTPLSSLRTNIEVLRQRDALDEFDQAQLLHDLSEEIDELTTLVANLVELARGSQREISLHEIQLDEIAEAIVRRAQSRFPSLDFALTASPTTVWGERQELERAIWNLVENAAKWSTAGDRVDIEVGGGQVTVRDHGPGIAVPDRPFIFDRFYRSETARSKPGSGLGLAIVRQIAEIHGGEITVAEADGGGTRLRLTLVQAGGVNLAATRGCLGGVTSQSRSTSLRGTL